MTVVDIVIPSYNTRQLTVDCIDSIIRHSHQKEQIIVVDNASVDDSVAVIKVKFPQVTIIKNVTNDGYAKACNQGARAGNGPYILFLNSDTKIVDSHWLDAMIQVFERDKSVAVVGPKLINSQNKITGCGVIGTNAKPVIRGWMEPNRSDKYNLKMECVSVCGACMMIKRGNIPQLGLMDERYPFYFEETDYCYNARSKGFKVMYTPATTVLHYHQGSSKDNVQLTQWFKTGQAIFNTKFARMMGDARRYG